MAFLPPLTPLGGSGHPRARLATRRRPPAGERGVAVTSEVSRPGRSSDGAAGRAAAGPSAPHRKYVAGSKRTFGGSAGGRGDGGRFSRSDTRRDSGGGPASASHDRRSPQRARGGGSGGGSDYRRTGTAPPSAPKSRGAAGKAGIRGPPRPSAAAAAVAADLAAADAALAAAAAATAAAGGGQMESRPEVLRDGPLSTTRDRRLAADHGGAGRGDGAATVAADGLLPPASGATRCGFVALLGASNAGKSTLLNQLIGAKVAIVTPKTQTTRCRVLGMAVEGDTQLIFQDTPGIFDPRTRLDRAMVRAAWSAGDDADLVAVILDAASFFYRGEAAASRAAAAAAKVVADAATVAGRRRVADAADSAAAGAAAAPAAATTAGPMGDAGRRADDRGEVDLGGLWGLDDAGGTTAAADDAPVDEATGFPLPWGVALGDGDAEEAAQTAAAAAAPTATSRIPRHGVDDGDDDGGGGGGSGGSATGGVPMIGAAADPAAALDPTTRSILTSLARRHARAVATARVGDHPFPRVLFVLNKMDVIPSAVHPELVSAMEAAVAAIFEPSPPAAATGADVGSAAAVGDGGTTAVADSNAAAITTDTAALAGGDDGGEDNEADTAAPAGVRERMVTPPIVVRDAASWAVISARTGAGVPALRSRLAAAMPLGPFLYPADDLTDMPLRLLAAEVTREAATLQLRREVPYDISVVTDDWKERPDGSVRVEQVLYVARTSQAIGSAARAEMGRLWGRPVHLFLKVKVRGGWKDERQEFARWGLDYNA
ncbi:hypothetical protein MMPV_004288 [Pyropia vietnamensis]